MSAVAARSPATGGLATATPPASLGSGALLAVCAAHVRGLASSPDNKRVRRRAAERLLAWQPDLVAWMARPTPARLADLGRSGAWPFVTWCFATGHLRPDLGLLLAKTPGDLYAAWAARHPDDTARVAAAARRFGWSATASLASVPRCHARPGHRRPRSPSALRPSPSPSCAEWRLHTSRRSPRRCVRARSGCGPTA